MSEINSAASPFEQSFFGAKEDDFREVVGGQSGSKVTKEGNISNFGGKEELGKQQFLELLVAQLAHQDPLSPSNDQEFVAQLAQFSSLETNQNIEKSIGDLSESMGAFMAAQASSSQYMGNATSATMLGKKARIEQTEFHYNGAGNVDLDLFKNSIGVGMVEMTNASGERVAFLSAGADLNAGDHQFSWNGFNENGEKVPPGDYFLRFTDTTGKQNKGFAFVEGDIEGVTFENGRSLLTVQGKSYPIEDLKQIVQPNTPESGDSNS